MSISPGSIRENFLQYYAISQERVDIVREFMEKNPQGSVVGDSSGITLKASGIKDGSEQRIPLPCKIKELKTITLGRQGLKVIKKSEISGGASSGGYDIGGSSNNNNNNNH